MISLWRSCKCYRSSPSFRRRRRSGYCPRLCNETPPINTQHLSYDPQIFGFFEVLAVTSCVLQARVCVDDTVFPVRSYGHCFRGLNAHMEATCRGSLLGLVLRWGGFGGLITAGKDNFLSDGTGEPAERAREKFSTFI